MSHERTEIARRLDRRFIRAGVAGLLLLSIVLVLRFTPLGERLVDLERWRRDVVDAGWTTRVVFILLAAALQIVVPRGAIAVFAGAVFGLLPGFLLAQCGSLLGSYWIFLLVRHGMRDAALALVGSRPRLSKLIGAPLGFTAVVLIRQIPIPSSLLTMSLGLSAVKHPTYLTASFVGFVPVGLLGASAGAATAAGIGLEHAPPLSVASGTLAVVASVVLVMLVARRVRRARSIEDLALQPEAAVNAAEQPAGS